MIKRLQHILSAFFAGRNTGSTILEATPFESESEVIDLEINPGDPFLYYLTNVSGVVEVDKLNLDSPALRVLKESKIKISVPLVSQGELIGLLNLGARRSEQEYSTDDKRLLTNLATQAAPALRVAQLVRQQQAEALARERLEQEMRMARVIQQTLLPKMLPQISGWKMEALWQPARAVSGDFYDFFQFQDGRLGVVIGDVTDKGMPAALVMATTRSILRSAAEHLIDPGKVLKRANDMLCPDIPANMFVTCLYLLLNPRTGEVRYANAGQNLPFRWSVDCVDELRARGMPLGLMPEMEYEEKEMKLNAGESLILYSDGLVEAHNPGGEMFSTPRIRDLLRNQTCSEAVIQCLIDELDRFTGPGWEQEDDVTFVMVERLQAEESMPIDSNDVLLTRFSLPSRIGNEREAMDRIAAAVTTLNIVPERIERLKTAVAEATMNAMEHGNKYREELPVEIEVWRRNRKLVISIFDFGGDKEISVAPTPDLLAKLDGKQSPRGWGLFLIRNMVDEMHVSTDGQRHIVELIMYLEGVSP